jgi:hypothetical protein
MQQENLTPEQCMKEIKYLQKRLEVVTNENAQLKEQKQWLSSAANGSMNVICLLLAKYGEKKIEGETVSWFVDVSKEIAARTIVSPDTSIKAEPIDDFFRISYIDRYVTDADAVECLPEMETLDEKI